VVGWAGFEATWSTPTAEPKARPGSSMWARSSRKTPPMERREASGPIARSARALARCGHFGAPCGAPSPLFREGKKHVPVKAGRNSGAPAPQTTGAMAHA
jgi:hypothetical protein